MLSRAAPPLACWSVAAVVLLVVPVRLSRLDLPIDIQLLIGLCHAGFALLVAIPVMAGTARATPIGRVLSSRPLVWTGLVSYGV